MLPLTISRPLYLSIKSPSGAQDQIFVTIRYGFAHVGCPFWGEGGFIVYNCCRPSLEKSYMPQSKSVVRAIYIYNFACRHSTVSQNHVTTNGQSCCLAVRHPSRAYEQTVIIVIELRVSWCGAPSLTGGQVCSLQLVLDLASATILGSESGRTRSYLYPPGTGYPCRRPLRLTGLEWRYSTRLQTGLHLRQFIVILLLQTSRHEPRKEHILLLRYNCCFRSKSIHVTFTTRRETCPPVLINNAQLPREDVKYLGEHLDRYFCICNSSF
jgi:hypothetical protein